MTVNKQTLVLESEYSPEQRRAIWADVERMDPELWHRCYPRIYEPYKPNEYASPKEPSQQIYGVAKKIEMGFVGESEKYEMMWACKQVQYRVPLHWVGRDLVEAVMHTTPPMEYDWYHEPLPLPAMTFMLPNGALTHPLEGNTTFVSFSRNRMNEDVPTCANGGPRTWASRNGAMTLVCRTEPYLHHWNIPYDAIKKVNLAELNAMSLKFDEHPHSSGWLTTPQMTPEDTHFGAKVAHLIFGLLLIIDAKPELVEKGELLRKVMKKGERPREFWSAHVIGRNYRLRREYQGGTHASPRGHWVDGYYRQQPYGPNNTLRKRKHIDPFWRGGDAE